jgi:hypothetical protein
MEEGKIGRMMEMYQVMIHLIYCKNFCKCHNVPQHNNKKLSYTNVSTFLNKEYILDMEDKVNLKIDK